MSALMRTQHLCVDYTLGHEVIHALTDLSLSVERGEILGLVGESGSGKSTLARCLALLQKPSSGKIFYEDLELTEKREFKAHQQDLRRRVQYIFQGGAVNLRLSLFEIIAEPLKAMHLCPRSELKDSVLRLMDLTALDRTLIAVKGESLSGGQLQRAAIARALAVKPELLIADEPTAALDVLTQAQIINLLRRLNAEQGLTIILITHDLHLVRYLADRAAVMLAGHVVELAPAPVIFKYARHPYTRSLISAMPTADPKLARSLQLLDFDKESLPKQGVLQELHPGHFIYTAAGCAEPKNWAAGRTQR
ncbi:MAG: ABC transporter ATP-binding protein [Proteobacteria bacterium]|uniref:ABC transporter ATP-binding protein n=1 Tax=Candidatus Avisuccinivibrio stercorigallinarum TaxID=2840704 RepID=A0A9D9DE48_9GAMM|nr:ABC transporter ATP-binding protein [Candidatus Avisuccinivibrio stercorigallinarum]